MEDWHTVLNAYREETAVISPTDQELASFLAERHKARMENESPFGCPDFDGAKAKAARIADIRAALARWGRPAVPPAPLKGRWGSWWSG